MTPQKQAFLHDPANGVYGDCWRTVIAVLLDMDRDDVPHFGCLKGTGDDGGFLAQVTQTREWLSKRGFSFVCIPFTGSLEEFGVNGWLGEGQYAMLMGESRSSLAHSVVIDGLGKIVCDPSQVGSGIIGPCADDGYYWIGLITWRGLQ